MLQNMSVPGSTSGPRLRFSSRGLTNPGLMRCWIDLPPQSAKFLLYSVARCRQWVGGLSRLRLKTAIWLAGESCERGKRLRWSRVEGAALGKPHPWRSPGAASTWPITTSARRMRQAPRLRFNRWGGAVLPFVCGRGAERRGHEAARCRAPPRSEPHFD